MFNRDIYLNKLIEGQNNQLVKVITGIRRCGKSFLLNGIFYNYLIKEKNIDPKHIIRFAFDNEEDIMKLDSYFPNKPTTKKVRGQLLIDSRKFLSYIDDNTKEDGVYYLLLDEIQNLENFVRVLNSFLYKENFDVYVTGSNSRFLSSEVDTEFGGRGYRIHLLPLSFNEYLKGVDIDKKEAFDEYIRYGGIPLVQLQSSDVNKVNQAISIGKETYLKDLEERHPTANKDNLEETLRVIASMISTPINPTRIENTFKSNYHLAVMDDTVKDYIKWFEEAYLINKVLKYDVKGRTYIGTPFKIYFEDIGIRNAFLNFRDVDETDLIENIVYNELRYRGFSVDVGSIKFYCKTDRLDKNKKPIYIEKETEVDFIATKGSKKYYIQVALEINNEEKKEQEYRSLRKINDSFKKIIIVKNDAKPFYTSEGFLRINLLDFLTDIHSLDL